MTEKPCILQWSGRKGGASVPASRPCYPVVTLPNGFSICPRAEATVFPNTRSASLEIRRLTLLGCAANGTFSISLREELA